MPRLQWILCLWIAALPLASIADHPIVDNPADPPLVETWSLREVWRLDCEEDESLPLIGIVNQAVVDEKGHVLLLDSQLAHVLEIGPDGEFIGTLSRPGQGPGELERPNTLFLASDGTVGLVQVFPGRIVFVNRDDTPAGSLTAQGDNPMFFFVREEAGTLVTSGRTMHLGEGGAKRESSRFIRSCNREGETIQAYLESQLVESYDPPVSDEAANWFPNWCWDQLADGTVVVASQRDAYRLEYFDPDGTLGRVVTRDFEPWPRTKEDRERVAGTMRMWGPEGELRAKKNILDTDPAIKSVYAMDDGRLWVSTCWADKDLPEGVFSRFDVFDPRGQLEKEVHVVADVNRDTDYFEFLSDGRFLWLRGMKSALDALYSQMEDRTDGDGDEEPVPVQVILMERAP